MSKGGLAKRYGLRELAGIVGCSPAFLSARPNHVLGTYGPMTVERTMSGPKLGYVLTVRCGGERVEIRTSPKGRSGMSVEHILYSSEGP